ncbi:TPA: hypothetical protein DEQ22_00950 [Candidatus Nomurabacteria bacterium]|uniref:Uncharacterized protein n=2 Tax=Candidatus Nomuraibacteriota TaxID=1752729 RepID=A0A1F6YLM5_9BACT|nr:MAG: hypothetical protein UV13_C0002G0033 [Parcubacteria group bacterium GW2011_GWC1_42_21]KKT00380.1 MAG: hypothetical protein UV77_C0004G0012 [Candidatus Nomurabacteria bacterium GW2011_GWA1_43_17]KKT11333.1 MAG: hypothetical protein UV91_C0007G0033 [Candidatus Nomurabacteria bacterium GW2011_GWF2_43_24]KKT17913.1 MAG: hypothetical protein UW01_C0007G0011 [Candidatus Nomurabacteria bacterium GW2011_GWA2_43_66]OGJ04864.1 MAG: hypothetical protein A2357_00775 [Candidatus Nomurabacteria bacte
MNKNKAALVFGSFIALIHFVWGLAIAFSWAQPWMDFVYRMHSLNNPFVVMPFNLGRSIGLVIITFIVGYVFGYVFAMLWNKFHNR